MKRLIFFATVLMIALGLTYPLAVSAGGFSASCNDEPLEAQMLTTADGHGVFCVTRHGVRGWIKAKGLVPDDAYTVWWVYFDDPSLCEVPGECGGPDFSGDNPLGVFGRMDSSIAPGSGKLHFSGRIGGFKPTRGAQIWMWIFGHGAADRYDGRHLARQLLTPELPDTGAPHLGIVVDGPLGFPAAVVMFDIP